MRFNSADELIAAFPENVQDVLQKIRQAVKEAAPEAEEAVSYNMLAFKQKGNLVWFGAFKNPSGYDVRFGLFFDLDKPLPMDLIKQAVKFRVKENLISKGLEQT